MRTAQIERVAVVGFEIQLDFHGFVVFGGSARGDLLGEFFDARVEGRNLQIVGRERGRKDFGGGAQLRGRDVRNIGQGLVADLGGVVKRIGNRFGGIYEEVVVAAAGADAFDVVGKAAAQAFDARGDEDRVAGERFHEHGVMHWVRIADGQGRRAEAIDAGGIWEERDALVSGSEPAASVEIGEDDAAPVHAFAAGRFAVNVNAHDDGVALLDFADFAEGDVVAEAGHQFGLQAERAEIAGGEARQGEKDYSADGERADGDECGGES